MRATPELSLHYAVADLLTRFAAPGVVWWHTPNNSLSAHRGKQLRKMGARAGVPDFIILRPDGYSPAFLELKSIKGKLSEAQLQFRDDVDVLGCVYFTAHDFDAASDFLADIGATKQVLTSARPSVLRRTA